MFIGIDLGIGILNTSDNFTICAEYNNNNFHFLLLIRVNTLLNTLIKYNCS